MTANVPSAGVDCKSAASRPRSINLATSRLPPLLEISSVHASAKRPRNIESDSVHEYEEHGRSKRARREDTHSTRARSEPLLRSSNT